MTVKPPESWPWPPELDAMTAAPAYHDLLSESERVRVLEAHVGPGETVPVHTHCWPGVLYILGVSDFVRRDPEGKVLVDTRADAPGPARVMCLGRSPQSTFAGERGRRGASQRHVRTQAGALLVTPRRWVSVPRRRVDDGRHQRYRVGREPPSAGVLEDDVHRASSVVSRCGLWRPLVDRRGSTKAASTSRSLMIRRWPGRRCSR